MKINAIGLLGFSGATAFNAAIGAASATKLCRSVVVKGMKALVTESLLAAMLDAIRREGDVPGC